LPPTTLAWQLLNWQSQARLSNKGRLTSEQYVVSSKRFCVLVATRYLLLFYQNKFLQSEIKDIIHYAQENGDAQAYADYKKGVVGCFFF
jgi:hypothetical protein